MHKINPANMILYADDDLDDCQFIEEALGECEASFDLVFVHDGVELLQYLHQEGSYSKPISARRPDLILLDLNMPRKDGREALAEIKADPKLRSIPVVVLSISDADEDILHTYQLGGAGFIIKPSTIADMVEIVKVLNQYWFEVVELSSGVQTNKKTRDRIIN